MKFSKLILAIVFSLAITANSSLIANIRFVSFNPGVSQCLDYEPETVNLSGQIVRGIFKNASNKKETVWLLKLDKAVCVNASDDVNVKAGNVTRMQMVLSPAQFREFKKYLNKRVTLSGTLFHGHTQHHFTDVLLTVSEVKIPEEK